MKSHSVVMPLQITIYYYYLLSLRQLANVLPSPVRLNTLPLTENFSVALYLGQQRGSYSEAVLSNSDPLQVVKGEHCVGCSRRV